MNLLSRLFGKTDPTSQWPAASGPVPQVELARRALVSFTGRLTFGDPLEAARFLGRPDRFDALGQGATLAYDRYGLTLEFEEGRFVHLTWSFVDDDGDATDGGWLRQRKGPDGLSLSPATTRDELLTRFGQPTTVQEFDDETILYFAHDGGLASEYLLNGQGRLEQWEVYLD